VSGIGFTSLDPGVRGAAAGLFLMMLVVLLRDRRRTPIVLLSAALAGGTAAYAIATAPSFPFEWKWWIHPLLAGLPVIFWLWARAAFDDDFVVRAWHGALFAATVGLGLLLSYGRTARPALADFSGRTLSLVSLVLALSATVQTVTTWRADLVAGRRRLRVAVLIGTLVYIAIDAGSDLASFRSVNIGISGSLARALGLCALAVLAGWSLLRAAAPDPAALGATVETPLDAAAAAHNGNRGDDDRGLIAPALLRRLDNLMIVERVYRQEGLTIGMLAVKLDLPEYRLRQVINEGLGYRNFNAFLNQYRIDEAKAALADPSQQDVPVLTIAMDAGFQTIGPFNRAFKAATGLTPTEFRRDARAQPPADPLAHHDSFGIGQSN
jgi:AraC-like DNA-binding protein